MVDRVRSRSTGLVDRCAQTCTALFGWTAGRPTRSTAREFCSLDLAPGPGGRLAESSALCIQASVDPPVDRWHNGQKSDRWLVDRAVDRQQGILLSWPPTAIFWEPINWVPLDYFLQDFKWVFKIVFLTLLSVYVHLF